MTELPAIGDRVVVYSTSSFVPARVVGLDEKAGTLDALSVEGELFLGLEYLSAGGSPVWGWPN